MLTLGNVSLQEKENTVKIGMNSALSATLITDGVSEDVALIMPIQIRG